MNEVRKAWTEANKEKVKAYQRAWRLANPDKNKEYKRAWREANKTQVADYYKNYYKMKKTNDLTNARARDVFSGNRVKHPNTYDLNIKCNVLGFTDADAKVLAHKIQKAVDQFATNIAIVLEENNCISGTKRRVKL